MKRTLALVLLLTHLGLLTGAVLSPHHGFGDHRCCHSMSAPVAWETVGPRTECGHCPMEECASMARCAGTTTAVTSSINVAFVEEFALDWEGELVAHRVTSYTTPLLPPPRT